MHKIFFVCAFAIWCNRSGAIGFDLKTYERSLKKYIPWSLTGTAQDLRSDAKHQLQMMLRAFVLLRPEASWDGQEAPTVDLITKGFKELHAYLALEGNQVKKPWVVDSLAYIAHTYAPEVQKLLEEARPEGFGPEAAVLLDKKKALFKEFSESLAAGQKEFAIDSNSQV